MPDLDIVPGTDDGGADRRRRAVAGPASRRAGPGVAGRAGRRPGPARAGQIELAPPPLSVARSLRLGAGEPVATVTVSFEDPAATTPSR